MGGDLRDLIKVNVNGVLIYEMVYYIFLNIFVLYVIIEYFEFVWILGLMLKLWEIGKEGLIIRLMFYFFCFLLWGVFLCCFVICFLVILFLFNIILYIL